MLTDSEVQSLNHDRLQVEIAKLMAETAKLNVESTKLQAETAKINRERFLYPVLISSGAFTALAGFAGVAFTVWAKWYGVA